MPQHQLDYGRSQPKGAYSLLRRVPATAWMVSAEVAYNAFLAFCKTSDRGYGERFGSMLVDIFFSPVGNLLLAIVACILAPRALKRYGVGVLVLHLVFGLSIP